MNDVPITKAQKRALSQETFSSGVQNLTVTADEATMRLDRFLTKRFPFLPQAHIQKMCRKGELKLGGKKCEPNSRIEEGQNVRVPPLHFEPQRAVSNAEKNSEDAITFLKRIMLYEDSEMMVINKPAGLAVQGGSGTTRHIDGLLMQLEDGYGNRPRLVHRLDKDTSGCLIIAKTRSAAAELAKVFRTRSARKTYWAVVAGYPKPKQGRISTWLTKEEREDESKMRVAKHGEAGASHAVTYYATVDTMTQKITWVSLKPVTGRTHQLRVHMAEIKHPILGDPKYFNTENWELPGGIQQKLHLHARRIVIPHPKGKGTVDVSAPLPDHMQQTFNLVGWDVKQYDPISEAPEE